MENAKYARLAYKIKWFLRISLVFQLVGYFTPGWTYHIVRSGDGAIRSRYMLALWYRISCVDDKCESEPLSDYESPIEEIVGPQVETTLALFLCIVAVYINYKKPNNNSTEEQQRVLAYIHMICCALSSILSITAVATFAHGLYGVSREESRHAFPFSLPFTGLGGVLAGLAFLTNVIWRPWKHAPLPITNHGYGIDNPAVNVAGPQNTGTVYDPATQTGNAYPLTHTGNLNQSRPTGNALLPL